MSAPVANFSYIRQELSVAFTDSSLSVPTTWAWNFGDPNSGGNNTSTSQNPTHVFSVPGTYSVTLIVTNTDGSSSVSKTLVVSEIVEPISIREMVVMKLPATINADTIEIENSIKIEQAYLAPLMNPEIPAEEVNVEASWPLLGNALVAELVAYKIIVEAVNKLILDLTNSATNSGGTTTTTSSGGLKKIVTGPSEAEWYDVTQTTTDFLSSTFKSGSVFEKTSVSAICSLSRRLGIQHPLCNYVKKRIILPILAKFS